VRVTYCDICNALIKHGEKKYYLVLNAVTEDGQIYTYDEITEHAKKSIDTRMYETCQNCKNILGYLFKMRREERQKITKKIKESMENKDDNKNNKGLFGRK